LPENTKTDPNYAENYASGPEGGGEQKNSDLLNSKCGGEDPPTAHVGPQTPPPVSSPVSVARSLVPDAPPGAGAFAIPSNDGGEVTIPPNMVHEFRAAYPAVNVEAELRAMRVWSLANQANRKTRGGMLKFVNGWLAREQNRARTQPTMAQAFRQPPAADPDRQHKERLEWLVLWAMDGRWPRNLSANGVWRDAIGVGAPPDDERTQVTPAEIASVPAAKRRLDAIRSRPS